MTELELTLLEALKALQSELVSAHEKMADQQEQIDLLSVSVLNLTRHVEKLTTVFSELRDLSQKDRQS